MVREQRLALKIFTEGVSYCADIPVKKQSKVSCDCLQRNSAGKSKQRPQFLLTTEVSWQTLGHNYLSKNQYSIFKSLFIIKYHIIFLYYTIEDSSKVFNSLAPLTSAQSRTRRGMDLVRPTVLCLCMHNSCASSHIFKRWFLN